MLTDSRVKNLKTKDRLYRVADKNGLAIEVSVKGVKKWRFRYRYNGKPSMISLGKYPAISLINARAIRDSYQSLLSQGINPSIHKQREKRKQQQQKTFKEAFEVWFCRHEDEWTPRTAKKQVSAFEKHIFPYIGNMSVESINQIDMLHVFRMMDEKGISETLKKVKGWSSRVFCDCVVSGLIKFDPTRDLPSDSFKKQKSKHYATVTSPSDIGELLKIMRGYKGAYQVTEALNLAPYLLLRPGELVGLEWKEVDFQRKLIRITSERMKMRKAHLVPMSARVINILKEIQGYGLSSKYVFPSPKKSNTFINPESLRCALRNLNIPKEKFTTHGFRAMASTQLYELGFREDVIERQLAHAESNKVKAAYNHAEHINERIEMMTVWSDYLDGLRDNRGT